MRLLIVTEDKVSESQGGVQRVTYSLSKFFEKNSIAVINAYLKQGDELNEDNDGRYSSFSLSGYHKRDFNRLISKLKVDIIINQVGFDVQALRFLKQSGVPIVSCLHSTPNYQIIEAELYIASLAVNAVNLKLYLRRPYLFSKRLSLGWKLREIYKRSDLVVLLSEAFFNSFADLSGLRRHEKLLAIPNPVKEDWLKVVPSTIFKSHRKQIICVGRLVRGKRIPELLEIWKEIEEESSEWSLKIIGDGPLMDTLVDIKNTLGLKSCSFVGHVEDMSYEYQVASVLLHTSAYEGWPMVLAEAQSFGVVPVVYDSFHSAIDIIDNGKNGFLVKDNDRESFINKVKILINSEDVMTEMASSAMNKSLEYSIDNIGVHWLRLLTDLSLKK